MIKNILNLGDAALYCDFGKEVNKKINTNVIKYFKNIKEKNIPEITNITPSYNKLIISFDPNKTNYSNLKKLIERIDIKNVKENPNNKINIPVCCEDKFSLDIKRLKEKSGLSDDKILEKFFNKKYFCYMTGFIAGMPFVGDLDQEIRVKRLETPRIKVPKGAVAITEQFANIYTFESPGGWNIIGNTPLKIFDNTKEIEPNLINPGDVITFKQITIEEYNSFNDKKLF